MFDVAGARVPSASAPDAPQPTKSRTSANVEHRGAVLHASGVATVASATRAPVPLIAIVPTASGVGSGTLPPVPCASWTR